MSKKVMVKNNLKVTLTISKAFGEMMGFQKYYDPLSHIFHIREMVKSYPSDQEKHHSNVYCDIVELHVVRDYCLRRKSRYCHERI